jgi:polar amino acid transport system substrate-binding protein
MSLAHADALDDIKKAGKIRIAIDLGVPPYGMTDDKLQPTGLDVEAARLLAKDWGLEFEHVPTTGASRIPALQTGKADLVISSLSYTAERAKVIDFSLGLCRAANGHRCPEVRRPQVAGRSRWEDGWRPCAARRTTRS